MTLDNWGERRLVFGSAAQAYAAGRPSYPIEAVRWALPEGAHTVLDLAAGTGKLTERLLELDLEVHAVEPDEVMRAQIPAAAQVAGGTAEAIPLEDASVDAVTVGQAYHWFDPPVALAEMARVLRPGGTVGLFWNTLDDGVPWVAELAAVIEAEERASFVSAEPRPVWSDAPGLTDPERELFAHAPLYDVERLEAFIVSRSQTILMAAGERAAMLDRVRAIAPRGEFALPLVCETWRGVSIARP